MQRSKTYDSFQHELEDYIKVQKARGLEPKTCLRKMREDYLGTFGYKEVDSRPKYKMSDQRLPYETVQAYYPRPYNSPQTLENRLPQQLPPFDSRMRLDSPSYYKLSKDCSSGKPVPLNLSQQDYHCGSYAGESDIYRHLSENSTTAHQASHRETYQKRKKHHVKDREKQEEEQPKHKKRKGCEETDSDKQKSIQEKQTEVETASVGSKKLKTRKEKNHREVFSKKEERKRKKEKKTQGQEKTDEEMLWDQSILGF